MFTLIIVITDILLGHLTGNFKNVVTKLAITILKTITMISKTNICEQIYNI